MASVKENSKKFTSRSFIFVAVVSLFAMIGIVPASGLTYDNTMVVSCDGQKWRGGVYTTQSRTGTWQVRHRNSSPTSHSKVMGISHNGNWLPTLEVGPGNELATWTGVAAGVYQVHAHRKGAYQCNGIAPGHGNYTFDYTAITS